MKRRKLRTALCVMLVGTVLAAFVAIAAEAGSQGDPLVTLSYLNDTFLGQFLGKVDTKIAERDKTLQQELEQRLDGGNFVRCNKGYLVNLRHISRVKADTVVVAGDELVIARRRRDAFLLALTDYYGGGGK